MTRKPFVGAAVLLALTACGGGDEIRNPNADNDLSAEETTQLVSAIQTSFGGAFGAASPTATGAPGASRFVAIPGGAWACPAGGHVTWSGNDNSSYDPKSGITYIATTIQMRYGDATNNLDDCEVVHDAVILDGSVNLVVAGQIPGEGVGATMTGKFSINRRGPTGGLVPRGSCWIFLQVMRGTQKVTGSVCGVSIS